METTSRHPHNASCAESPPSHPSHVCRTPQDGAAPGQASPGGFSGQSRPRGERDPGLPARLSVAAAASQPGSLPPLLPARQRAHSAQLLPTPPSTSHPPRRAQGPQDIASAPRPGLIPLPPLVAVQQDSLLPGFCHKTSPLLPPGLCVCWSLGREHASLYSSCAQPLLLQDSALGPAPCRGLC